MNKGIRAWILSGVCHIASSEAKKKIWYRCKQLKSIVLAVLGKADDVEQDEEEEEVHSRIGALDRNHLNFCSSLNAKMHAEQ